MTANPQFRAVAVVLPVTDARGMIACFVEKLGFTLQGSVGDAPSWASLMRDGHEVMLVCGDHPAPASDWCAYFYVGDVDALHAEFTSRGADIVGPPADKPYRNREFEVRFPDGRLAAFASSL